MEFEPLVSGLFEPAIQIGLNRFEPVSSNRTDRIIIRHLISILIAFCKKAVRTTLRIVARAGMLVLKTASAPQILCRRKGGSK